MLVLGGSGGSGGGLGVGGWNRTAAHHRHLPLTTATYRSPLPLTAAHHLLPMRLSFHLADSSRSVMTR